MLKFRFSMAKFELTLLKYFPSVLSKDNVNIGVMLLQRKANVVDFAALKFRPSWDSVSVVDPNADIDFLKEVARDMEYRIKNDLERNSLIHQIEDSFSNQIQLSSVQEISIQGDPVAELDNLVKTYCSEQISTLQEFSTEKNEKSR